MSKTGEENVDDDLPEHLKEIRDLIFVEADAPTHTTAIEDPYAFSALGVDNSFKLPEFLRNFEVKIVKKLEGDPVDENVLVFDLIGIDAPIANTLRRIMLAEVPTIAIERVNILQNTSILQDEVLAHRLGLIPIYADPREFSYRKFEDGDEYREEENETARANSKNTLVFTLHKECVERKNVNENAAMSARYENHKIYSKDLKWVPQAGQKRTYRGRPVKTVHDDILITQLRPGHVIEAELFCEKGIGKDHAKWQPVSTVAYRTMPIVELTKDIFGTDAEDLVKRCPRQVFDIEDLGDNQKRARVREGKNRRCTTCRECIRDTPWKDIIKLRRKRDHFIFTVESTGIYSCEELLLESLRILKQKTLNLLNALENAPTEEVKNDKLY